ncbi:HEPN/Toprim-associated domain-containing protein [Aliivibrio sp. S4TY2]|uniref:HEPN/Toprim-associated domain-containing protein n=1 Tax=unclassified Aliivibrio TaxID=2645654 RepID=UPI0023784363|nr:MULTISPECIES: HEPN/Toprim-associated domain-containing protein [unclassified Aliivibrio]MDD9158026.1 HEPN/Toprim-associated domain-containing protein [Aliivibrio sp. S4TY2]MDD9161931.1 HEPN/Toprim-associated domain-containing protein [Aliivibrio sp. S4TY1]MDD9166023.1 HEPN/Toprim-associated domain-containing protein [Aliivibrio sp. S4MY2]MDD9170011.1 HEPN/Toprim-associated domain-containing protein [Aliivibrio sp. S4MY4]MDD9187062.1 HEPN/Toprim-associated domain-containing protein [Aliivibr
MGSFADININNQELLSWKNTYDEWFFTKQDRVREVNDDEDQQDFIGYKIDAKTLKRRLQLAGYDLRSAEQDFNEVKSSWILEMKETLELCKNNPDSIYVDDVEQISADLKIVESHSFQDWLQTLPKAFDKLNADFDTDYFNPKVIIDGEPLLSFMLSVFHSVYDKNQGFAGTIFPCKYVETYAVVLLEHCDDESECVLDITDIVNGGWVTDFDDIAEVQAGETKFHQNFCTSLGELAVLNETTENATLQRMVFASVITAMEAYLSDTMKSHVLNRSAVKRRFVESHQVFKEKLAKKDVFAFLDTLDKTLNTEIDKISFHNIDTVKDLYQKVLACDFPEDKLDQLRPSVFVRHDIVHRNGKKSDGFSVDVSQQDVIDLIELVKSLIRDIDQQILDGLLID